MYLHQLYSRLCAELARAGLHHWARAAMEKSAFYADELRRVVENLDPPPPQPHVPMAAWPPPPFEQLDVVALSEEELAEGRVRIRKLAVAGGVTWRRPQCRVRRFGNSSSRKGQIHSS
jgi:hypothetical protein